MAPLAAPLLVALTGPTGTGKSDLAVRLVNHLAARVPMEIVSADSALVYRGMDIGTAKPSREARAQVAHHLIDIRDPAQSYSAGEYVRDARASIAAIQQRGKLPLVVGGTLLYLRALREGLAVLPPASTALRQAIDAQARRDGWPSVHQELARVDPAAAARIASSDAQRIQRALEVYRLTGVPISDWQRRTVSPPQEFTWLRFALMPPLRPEQTRQLGVRFHGMLAAGLLDEVRALYQRGGLSEQHPSMRAVGYRQLWQHCAGDCTLEQASARAVTATAQLAKRQLTWLRREAGWTALVAADVGLLETLSTAICSALLA